MRQKINKVGLKDPGKWGTHRDPEFLNYWYWNEMYSTNDLAEMCGVDGTTIWNWMKRLGVPTRSRGEGTRTKRSRGKICEASNQFYAHGGVHPMHGRTREKSPSYKHGDTRERLYQTWINMKRRCYCTTSKGYKHYGKKGIFVCPEWLDTDNGYINFKKDAIANGYADDLQIHRENNKGGYSPENATFKTASKHAQLHCEERRQHT